MTLRENWEVYALSTIADHDELNINDVFKWFLAQFDSMLAEDIENVEEVFRIADECEDRVEKSGITSILEARRLSLKK